MREPLAITRRGIAAAFPLAIAAVGLPAVAQGAHPDAALLALRPSWLDAQVAHDASFEPLAAAERLMQARVKAEPHRDRATIEVEAGYARAYDNQSRACYAEWAMADRVFETPATTTEGIRFKLEVLKAFEGCETPHLDGLLKRDLLRMAGIFDA